MKPSDDTRARVKALTEQLETGVKAVFESEKYKDYLKAMSKFHHYSFGNVMLILMQCPEASMVAGYTTWKKQFDRTVKKGEHGIMILAPAPYKRIVEIEKIDPLTKAPILDANGDPVRETDYIVQQNFKVVYVFDVSQTEGRELPCLGVGELSGEVEHFARIFAAVEALSPVPVEYRPAQKSKGCYSHWEQKIYLNRGMSQVQTLKTLIHETAHALLHARPEAADKDRHTKEVEAESIAYVVCQHFGIDTADYSFPYVTAWSSGKELDELKASLDCISKTASGLITAMESACPELAADKAEKTKEKCVSR